MSKPEAGQRFQPISMPAPAPLLSSCCTSMENANSMVRDVTFWLNVTKSCSSGSVCTQSLALASPVIYIYPRKTPWDDSKMALTLVVLVVWWAAVPKCCVSNSGVGLLV